MKKVLFLLFFVALNTILLNSLASSRAIALSGSEFQAGRIMDDGVFFSSSNISVDGVQAFLDSKVPTCDTNGTQPYAGTTRADYGASKGYPAPYVCLKDYAQDTTVLPAEEGLCNGFSGGRKSAAQIIHEVGVSCGVNPKIILVLLQKEQSLITDDWPWSKQYTAATGYFCPDTAPCNPEFAGFFKQVYYGVRQFKRYAQTPDNWGYRAGVVNYVQYNPNANCGGSNIFIQNQATAGLYIYTPYQPNEAALSVVSDNSPGGEVQCGAYGNRNFWWQYNKWFGSTLGAMIRTTTSNSLFYTEGQKRFTVPSMELAAQFNLGVTDVRFVSEAELNSIPIGSSPLSDSIGQVVKSDDDSDSDGGSLYLISKGLRIPFVSLDQFTNFGFNTNDIRYLPLSTIQRLPQTPNQLSNFVQAPDLSVYKVESDKIRPIFELSKLAQLNPSNNISALSSFTFSNWSLGTPLVDGDYVAIEPDSSVRLYKDDKYYRVPSLEVFDCWKLGTVKTFRVKSYSITNGVNIGDLTCFAQKSTNEAFIMAKDTKYALSSGVNLKISKPSDSLIDRATTTPLKTVIKGSGSELSILESNQRRPIFDIATFVQMDLDDQDITTLPNEIYKNLSYGPRILPIGQVLLEPNGGLSVVSSRTNALQITSIRQYQDFAYDTTQPLKITISEQSAYTTSVSLPYFVKTNSGAYLLDGKVRYFIPAELDGAFGIDRTNLPLNSQDIIKRTLPWTLTRFVKSPDNPAVYYIENGSKRPISSWQRVVELGGSEKILILTSHRIGLFPTGPSI